MEAQSPPNADDIKQLAQSQFAGSAQRFVESKLHREGDDLHRMVELAQLSCTCLLYTSTAVDAGWAAVCQGLIRHPEFQLY